MNTSGSEEQAKTTRNVAIEIAMDLCIDEKDEERESEAQSAVRAKKRARPPLPTLKNHVFLYLYIFLHIAKLPNLLGFEHLEYASLLCFEKCCRMH